MRVLLFLIAVNLFGEANWSGPYPPCNRHSELLRRDRMELGVRISTVNPTLARQFRRALDFWARTLDMRWYEEDSDSCSIQLVDGAPELFDNDDLARAHLPDWSNFQGWVAFDSRTRLTNSEYYAVCIHELGHLFGLGHNASPQSVMYYLDIEGQEQLDEADLTTLASRHKLRIRSVDKPVSLHVSLVKELTSIPQSWLVQAAQFRKMNSQTFFFVKRPASIILAKPRLLAMSHRFRSVVSQSFQSPDLVSSSGK